MLPLKDDVPREGIPIMTWSLIGINIMIFLYLWRLSPAQTAIFYDKYSLIPARFFTAGLPTNYFSLISTMFLHGNLQHVLSNMWILWLFGDNVEDRMGSLSFLCFYLLTGVLAGLVHVIFGSCSFLPTVGASGAIAGVMAGYMLLFPRARVLTLIPIFIIPYFTTLPSFVFIGIWFITQFYYGAISLGNRAGCGGVAWWAHIGGFIAGMLLYRFFLKKDKNYQWE